MDDLGHMRIFEALIFASTVPVKESLLKAHLSEDKDLSELMEKLCVQYEERGVRLVRIGDGWAFRTAPDLADVLRIEKKVRRKFSRAATETLAIIAYHQPITRTEIEEIRGVTFNPGTLSLLLETGWVIPMGRRPAPGQPMLWGTGAAFLDHFGLPNLDALPGREELKDAGLLDRWHLAAEGANDESANGESTHGESSDSKSADDKSFHGENPDIEEWDSVRNGSGNGSIGHTGEDPGHNLESDNEDASDAGAFFEEPRARSGSR